MLLKSPSQSESLISIRDLSSSYISPGPIAKHRKHRAGLHGTAHAPRSPNLPKTRLVILLEFGASAHVTCEVAGTPFLC
jgi:hypothetical protein